MSISSATNTREGKSSPMLAAEPLASSASNYSRRNGEVEGISSNTLRREFRPRHVAMLSIAGAIGTGLIIGSGTALARGGPASMLLAYSIIGVVIYFVMTSLGEMAAFLPMDQGFNGYATRYVDPALGFATGWNYFFKYAMVLPNNLTAAGLIVQYWRPDLNVAIWVTIFAVVIITINFLHVTSFGESEFILATIKALVLIVVILTCFIISAGGSPSGQTIGFRYWHETGAFASFLVPGKTGQFLGFWACLVQACFAYTGTEVVGAAYGETPNPRRNIPRSVGQTLWRICIFYILGVWALGMAVPYNNENLVGATKAKISAAASPFVIAIKLAGIQYLPDIVNACLLVFVTSSANTDIYVASRTLYSLAKDGHAPQIFRKTNARGVPIYAVGISSLFALLAYMNVNTAASTVFGYFVSLVTVFGTINWINILCAYVGFRKGLKAQGIPLTDLPYRGPFQPYGAYISLGLTVLITFFNGYNAFIPTFTVSTFLTSYC